jgi:hypothetical protein
LRPMFCSSRAHSLSRRRAERFFEPMPDKKLTVSPLDAKN